tara:strand:+ start:1921 stop:3255 length:1335 start_codon:yes stop_codon:yes gene_type:complete
MKLPDLYNCTIAVIGLGYVGLPLALEFSTRKKGCLTNIELKRKVIGFDVNRLRIKELINKFDRTGEACEKQLKNADNIIFTHNKELIKTADVYIITVPTPINDNKEPDLKASKEASLLVGETLSERKSNTNPVIIYESTVFPGATEDIFIPIIQKNSGLRFNKDFFCAYSPERINPGDKSKRLKDIVKLTSGSNAECAKWVNSFYGSIIDAGTFLTSSIRVAEAAKVIENTQRDLNIALVNEFSYIFDQMNIDTLDVLDAASTKWNFLNFKPGLVGGHCIGVDPYYLTWKCEQCGYKPKIVLSGREINEKMTSILLKKIVKNLKKFKITSKPPTILIFGICFKEDCPDIRNSKVIEFIKLSIDLGFKINIYDPIADIEKLDKSLKKFVLNDFPSNNIYDVLFLAVPHKVFKEHKYEKYNSLLKSKGFILDLKGILGKKNNIVRP